MDRSVQSKDAAHNVATGLAKQLAAQDAKIAELSARLAAQQARESDLVKSLAQRESQDAELRALLEMQDKAFL